MPAAGNCSFLLPSSMHLYVFYENFLFIVDTVLTAATVACFPIWLYYLQDLLYGKVYYSN